jgi:hypothetical protein
VSTLVSRLPLEAKFHLPCTSFCCIVATLKGRHLPRLSNGDSRLTKAYCFGLFSAFEAKKCRRRWLCRSFYFTRNFKGQTTAKNDKRRFPFA